MNQFSLGKFAMLLNSLDRSQAMAIQQEAGKYSKDVATTARQTVDELAGFCHEIGFEECSKSAYWSGEHLRHEPINGVVANEMENLREALMGEAFNRSFLYVENDRVSFLENHYLFGEHVKTAFFSADTDIIQAGNCLAAECTTAVVFHLMRAAEFALRAVARDRGIKFADKPLEQKEWGQILGKLEAELQVLQRAPSTNWKTTVLKETQIRYYSELIQELRAFNSAWRRHCSHADTTAFYDRDSALSIFNHVKTFMQKAAEKLSESKITEQYWSST